MPNSTLLAGINTRPGNVDVRNDYAAGGNSRSAGAGLKVSYTFDGASPLANHILSSITSFATYHMDDFQDLDGTEGDIMRYTLINGKPSGFTGGLYQYGTFDVKSRTEEVRLASPDSGALRYVLGLWYGGNRLERELTKAPAGTAAAWYNAQARNTSYALFGQSSWEFLPRTSLVTGLRLNREDTGYGFTRFLPPPSFDRIPLEHFGGNDRNRDITGKVGLQHQLDRDTMLYGLYSTGHKGVAYDLTSGLTEAVAKNQPVPAETARNIEFGAKLSLLDGRAMLNLAAFRTSFKGFQQSAGFIDADGIYRTTLHSIGGLRTSGFEADGSWRVSRGFTLNGSFAYTRAIITEFENGPCYSVLNAAGTGTLQGGNCKVSAKYNNTAVADLSGRRLPNAPKLKLNLGSQYDVSLPQRSFNGFVTAAYRWQSDTLYALNQDPGSVQGAYGIANLGFGIKDKKDAYKLSFFINNVFDKLYANSLGNSVGGSAYSVKAPNPNPHLVNFTTWMPPRDYTRYVGARLDMSF